MKTILVVAPLTLLSLSTTLTSTKAQCSNLIWNDEFDGTSLDTSKWSHQGGDGCDLGEGMCGWGNAELQWYQPENLEVSDGTLKIHAKFENNRYTSARIRSMGKGDFNLASSNTRLQARAKVPKNSMGLWPAFWMMPTDTAMNLWPAGGEIDIMEFIGKEPNKTQGYLHYGNKWNDKAQKGGLVDHPNHAGDEFHTFAIQKTPNTITWILDGQPFKTVTKQDMEPKFQWPFEAAYHFILNLAIGGHWPEYPDATTQFPNTFEVDYVRVYDLGPNPQPIFKIEGDSLVRKQANNVQYCLDLGTLKPEIDYNTNLEWTIPPGATLSNDSNLPPNCIAIDFGSQSGYVRATVNFNCGESQLLSLPVELQDYYGQEFAFLTPNAPDDRAVYLTSTGTWELLLENSGVPPVISYKRELIEVYDVIQLETDSIPDPQLYVESAKKFFMDAFSRTAAPCTRFWIHLEDSSLATPDNYPIGRHSRYISFLQKDSDFQRLEFDFYDVLDPNTQRVDRIVLLIDAFQQRADTYYLRNFISASAGACNDQSNDQCEPLSQNTCQTAAKTEQGACTDGFNNDGFGYNGDAPTDCEDSDCWGLDPACMDEVPVPDPIPDSPTGPFPIEPPPAPVPSPTEPVPAPTDPWADSECTAHAGCSGLIGSCCPTANGVFLACCDTGEAPSPSNSGVPAPTEASGNAPLDSECSANTGCAHLSGSCCPTEAGVFLACCDILVSKSGELRGSQP